MYRGSSRLLCPLFKTRVDGDMTRPTEASKHNNTTWGMVSIVFYLYSIFFECVFLLVFSCCSADTSCSPCHCFVAWHSLLLVLQHHNSHWELWSFFYSQSVLSLDLFLIPSGRARPPSSLSAGVWPHVLHLTDISSMLPPTHSVSVSLPQQIPMEPICKCPLLSEGAGSCLLIPGCCLFSDCRCFGTGGQLSQQSSTVQGDVSSSSRILIQFQPCLSMCDLLQLMGSTKK